MKTTIFSKENKIKWRQEYSVKRDCSEDKMQWRQIYLAKTMRDSEDRTLWRQHTVVWALKWWPSAQWGGSEEGTWWWLTELRARWSMGWPFFSQAIVGVGIPSAWHRSSTVLAAGFATSFISCFFTLHRGGPPGGDRQNHDANATGPLRRRRTQRRCTRETFFWGKKMM